MSYTVTVNAPGSGTPTGNVTVTDGVNNCVGSVASGTCNMSFTSPGSKSLAATYAGDVNFNGSTSASVPHQVNKADTATTILSDLPDPSNIGQSVVVTYSVSVNDPGSGTPTGSVTVSDGTDSCSATVAAPSCTINFSSVDTKTLTATYAGDSKFNGSTSASVSHQVNQANTTTTIISLHNPSLFGQSVTFTATITSTAGISTGSITFRDGATPIITVTLSGDTAAFSTTTLAVGAHPITALYPGDVNHLGSTNTPTPSVTS